MNYERMGDETLPARVGRRSPFIIHPSYRNIPTGTSFIILSLLLAGCPDIIQEDVLIGTLAGHVAAEGGPVNLQGAEIYMASGKVYDPARVTSHAERTNAFGKFTITRIHEGWVTIKVVAPGFQPLLRTVQVKRDGIKYVDLQVGYGKQRHLPMTILFERDYDVWQTDEYGMQQVNLTQDLEAGFNKQYPNWSPDHQTVAFFRWQRGQALTPPAVWECRADLSDCRQLAALPQVIHSLRRSPRNPARFLLAMASPDGSSTSQIYLLDTAQQKFANLSGVLAQSIEENPTWAPDGEHFAYTSYTNDRPQIFTLSLQGGARKQLTGELIRTGPRPATEQGENRDPAWSPDGTRIAFISNRGGSSQVWLMNADGTGPVQLTNLAQGSCSTPLWSPDGNQLLFNSTYLQKNAARPNAELWVIGMDGRDLHMVSNDAIHPSW